MMFAKLSNAPGPTALWKWPSTPRSPGSRLFIQMAAALRRIRSAQFLPNDLEPSRSYHLFFVCPEGEAFREVVAGTVRTGWSVCVSLLAPFAVITLSDMSTFEDGCSSGPSLEPQAFTETGQRIDPEAEFRKSKGERAFQVLMKLRDRICGILEKHGIVVLPEAEWLKPVAWLRSDEAVFAETAGEPIRVLDAFFFECL
jgi:hypothetical protein